MFLTVNLFGFSALNSYEFAKRKMNGYTRHYVVKAICTVIVFDYSEKIKLNFNFMRMDIFQPLYYSTDYICVIYGYYVISGFLRFATYTYHIYLIHLHQCSTSKITRQVLLVFLILNCTRVECQKFVSFNKIIKL